MILVALRNIQLRGRFVFAGVQFSCEESEGARLVDRGFARALEVAAPVSAPVAVADVDAFSLDAVGAAVADVSAPSPKRRRKK